MFSLSTVFTVLFVSFVSTYPVDLLSSLYYSYSLYPRTQLQAEDREEQKKREAEKSEWQPPKSESSSDEGDTDEELAQDEDLRK